MFLQCSEGPKSEKHTFYTVKCMFFNFGMKFQGSKLEIEAPESKTYILHCKMYVFFNFGMKFQDSKLEIEAPKSKSYILHCKMYVFPILEWNFKIPSLKLKPQSQHHTFYTIKCMFLAQGLFSEKACLDHANCVKTYILHSKMYVFYNSGMISQDSKTEI